MSEKLECQEDSAFTSDRPKELLEQAEPDRAHNFGSPYSIPVTPYHNNVSCRGAASTDNVTHPLPATNNLHKKAHELAAATMASIFTERRSQLLKVLLLMGIAWKPWACKKTYSYVFS